MSPYPPDRHILRDLRFSLLSGPGAAQRVLLPLPHQLHSPTGATSLGALAVAVDLAAAGVAMRTIAPDWLATAELEIHALDRAAPAVAVATPRLLRSGRTTTVFEVEVRGYDREEQINAGPGLPLALSTMTFVRITRPDATADLEHPAEAEQEVRVDFALPDSGLERPWLEEMHLEVVEARSGTLELPRGDFAINSFGSLQGGVVATLAQAACEAARTARSGRPASATDLCVHYLAQGRGPYRTHAECLRAETHADLYRVTILDLDSGTTMATASATAAS